MDEIKAKAIEQYRQRRKSCHLPVVNEELPVGSPMYFYCKHCGMPLEVLVEEYLFPPLQCCSQCQGLIQMNWLKEALNETN